ncbi:MAG: SAM-dependent methyltransferase [Myxococcales bacterium]|nr:SAM-dependent methyltransferase [Myxococcales bacterium]
MREGRPSITATWVAAWRGLATYAPSPIARDAVAEQLIPTPYAQIVAAARKNPRAIALVHALADRVSLGRSRHLALRTRAIDEAVDGEMVGGTRQLVLVGAGLCARAYRLPSLRDSVVYEVDHPATQGYKRSRAEALTPLARRVHHVPSDFERDDLTARLAEAGHDARQRTVFICEGVTMYLSRAGVEQTLRGVREAAAPGSVLLMTYFERAGSPFARTLTAVLRGVSEPVMSAFSATEIGARLDAHDFDVVTDEGDPEWSPRWVGERQPWSLERLVAARRRR